MIITYLDPVCLKLPHSRFVHLWRVGQVIAVVSTTVDGYRRKWGAGAKNFRGHGVQGAGQVGLGAGRVSRGVRHDVSEALSLARGVMSGQGVVHGPQRGP